MTSAVRDGPRSSARLIKKIEEKIDEGSISSHNSGKLENAQHLKVSSEKLDGTKSNQNTQSTITNAAIRTTTSRRGGRSGISHSPRAALKRSRINQNSTAASGPPQAMKEKAKRDMVPSLNSTPSSAAAAAAAVAKALCDNPNRNRYGVDSYRGFHQADDRQNVFRTRGEDNAIRITTRSTESIVRNPKTSGNSTVRVMGSHTPTHIPRPHNGRGSYDTRPKHESRSRHFSPRSNSPPSIFRERPPVGTDSPKHFNEMECSRQDMLLSLKSGSFDLVSPGGVPRQPFSPPSSKSNDYGKAVKKEENALLSPEAPPQIQHSHHDAMKSEHLFFNPRTPKTPKTPMRHTEGLQGTPSFSLFDKSFDSFGDGGYLRSPNVGGTVMIDQALPATFSLVPSYDECSPRKRSSLMASPNPNIRFTFSPKERQDGDDFPGGSPGISLDTVEAIDAPFMPRTPTKSPAVDPLLSSNVMLLEPSKTIRKIPAPRQPTKLSQPKRPSAIPIKKRPASLPVNANLGHRMTPPFRSPPSEINHQMRAEPPAIHHKKGEISPSNSHPALRHRPRPPNHLPLRPGSVHSFGNYGRSHSQYYGGRSAGVYVPDKRDTSLASLDADKIYKTLSHHKHAFEKCSHLLPGFERTMLTSCDEATVPVKVESSTAVSVSPERVECEKESKSKNEVKSSIERERKKADQQVAKRRIVSAICAFGGNSSGTRTKTKESHYKSDITSRFFEHQNRISWDVEEDPPVKIQQSFSYSQIAAGMASMKRKDDPFNQNPNTPKKMKYDHGLNSTAEEATRSTPNGDAPKMRYRCKLCGQPKQNHKCPYQKSLQRSIGVTVHAAVNSFTAAEPGDLAPALSEMNNFVPSGDTLPEITPSRPKRAAMDPYRTQTVPFRSSPHVTPEAMRSMNQARKSAGYPMTAERQYDQYSMGGRVMPPTPLSNIRRRRILSPEKSKSSVAMPGNNSDLVFVEATPLRTEQFRFVQTKAHSGFEYPPIPLPYPQRKSLSDNLFELSNELPLLKEECAVILRKARETDVWDIAVAELLAQLIVAIHCPAKDTRLEGLSRYLSSLGIAC